MDLKNNKNIKEALKQSVKEWCEDSTHHALPRISKSESIFVKGMWILFLIMSFGYCTYTITESIIAYYKNEVTVDIKDIPFYPAPFPGVTICNINPFNEQYALSYIEQNIQGAECFNISNQTLFGNCYKNGNYKNADLLFYNFMKQMIREVASKNLSLSERIQLGYQLDRDMLISCSFNGVECFSNNFTHFWSNKFGNCYTFNQGNNTTPIINTSSTGDSNGLHLVLTVGTLILFIYFVN